MAQTIATFKQPIALLPLNMRESVKITSDVASPKVSNSRSNETEIVGKIDNIIAYLRALEENFLKTKQDLQKKSTLEGRENNKICAVQGKLISNMTKYYQSLEQDIDTLSQTLKSSFDKITKEFKQLQCFAKSKSEPRPSAFFPNQFNNVPTTNSGQESPNIRRTTTEIKVPAVNFPTIRSSKSGDMRAIVDASKGKPTLPFSLKAKSTEGENVVKKVNFERCENLTNGTTLVKTRVSTLSLPISKVVKINSKSPAHSDDNCNGNDMAIFDSPCNTIQNRSKVADDEKNRSTSSGSLSDSNEDFSEDEESIVKSKRMNSCFEDEIMALSLDGSMNFKF